MTPNSCRYYSRDQDITFRMTTPEEERDYFVRAKAGDRAAFEFVIHNHLLFAAMQAQAQVKGALPKDEVISAANFAVMKAYQTFDPSKGFRFTTYLRPFLQGEVCALWKSKFAGGGNAVDSSALGMAFNEGHSGQTNQRKWNEKDDQHWFACSMDPTQEIPDESVETFDQIDLRQFNQAALGRGLLTLPERDAELIRLHYVEEMSFADIGRQRGVSREAIRATHARILDKLKKFLRAEGVASAV